MKHIKLIIPRGTWDLCLSLIYVTPIYGKFYLKLQLLWRKTCLHIQDSTAPSFSWRQKFSYFSIFFSLMKRMSWQNQRADIENESNVKVTYDQHVSQIWPPQRLFVIKGFFFWKHNCVIFFWSKIAMALDKHISDLKKSRYFQICI